MQKITPDQKEIARVGEHITALRRRLHENAELGFALDKTRRIIEDELTELGVPFFELGRGSIVARIGRGKVGVLLRADMDALAMDERAEIAFASKNGCMHACGHDMHTAMLLGALRLLLPRSEELSYEVRFLFQAAEEVLLGAQDAIDAGVLQKWEDMQRINNDISTKCKESLSYNVESTFIKAAFTVHTMVSLPMKEGTVVVSSGGVGAPSSAFFRVDVEGVAAHMGAPHMGVDALAALRGVWDAIRILPLCEAPSGDAMLGIGRLCGGEAANVVPAHAFMEGTLRSLDDATAQRLLSRMEEIATLVPRAFRATGKMQLLGRAPTLKNDGALSAALHRRLAAFLPKEELCLSEELVGTDGQKRSGGSEDFASFSHRIPSLLIGVCAGDLAEGYEHPLHHPCVRFDERSLLRGALVYLNCALLPPPS